ncbi:hypothetical protein GQX73_g10564 [Xylaria multiplex]|uniref:NACHT-NTPase sigma domain-containing protein n=1 Tax=Xylaria multiplex TaxID=323545 RepID=A0A7C8MMC2_9PEZI|nr:hypothetical protein GQX73_g10564 [Xylaria multiplex]
MPGSATCNGTTKEGNICRNYAKNGHSFCRHHPGQLKPIRDHITDSSNTNAENPGVTIQSNDQSHLYYNAQSGTQSNNLGSGNQFHGAKFESAVNFYQNRNENCGNHYNTNNVHNTTTISGQNVPETREEYRTCVSNHTINNPHGFEFDHKERTKEVAGLLSNDVDNNFALGRELAQKVIKLDMFDSKILCGQCP